MNLNPNALQGLLARNTKLDRAVLALAAILLIIGVALPHQFFPTLKFTGLSLLQIAPYLLLSVGIAAYLKAAGADQLLSRVFKGHIGVVIITAALFGGLSPFCSCGVIPLILALLVLGVPLAPVMAFWLSSPVMSPDMYVLTAAELGVGFATAKTLAAVGVGLLGGYATLLLQRMGAFADPLLSSVSKGCCASAPAKQAGVVRWRFWEQSGRRRIFWSNAGDTTFFLVKWLALAFVLESLMVAYLPARTVAGWLGGDSFWSIPLSVLVGIPAYLNGYAAIPLVSGLMQTGMAPGAGMAFMTAGAMTSIPAAVAVYALVKKTVFAWYLFLAMVGASLSGILYQLAVS